jgi:hypothetical protein
MNGKFFKKSMSLFCRSMSKDWKKNREGEDDIIGEF